MRFSFFFATWTAFMLAVPGAWAQSFVDNTDPPFWWTDMPVEGVQLMIHGEDLKKYDIEVDHPGVTVEKVEHGDSPHYAFVYLKVAESVAPGILELKWLHPDHPQRAAETTTFELRARSPRKAEGYSGSDAICLITPDRFSNGNPDNDAVSGLTEAPNRSDDHGRHGGDLAGIRNHLEYLSGMGFTAVWLNPLLENNQPQWSYHGYATTDYYRVDPRFGTNAEYQQLADAAQQNGLKLIMDMIMNHCGSEHPWMDDLPTKDWINNSGTFSPTTHRRTTLRDPYATASDLKRFSDGWFVKEMPDLNQRQPLLADYLIQNTIWWVEYLGLSGIRMDTYPYSDADFMTRWTCNLRAAYPHLNICGEEWSLNPAVLAYWQEGQDNPDGYTSCLPGLLDFPLHHAFMQSMNADETWQSNWVNLYEMLGNDFLYPDPFNHIVFPDNHDMSRVHTQLGDDALKTRLAVAFFATTRGIPQFYYGTEILMSNAGDDSHGNIRSDFPGGWAGDTTNGFTGEGLSPEALDFQDFTRRLLHWRQTSSAVHNGTLTHYVPEGEAYVYFRQDSASTVMVVLNQSDSTEVLSLSRFDEVLNGRRTFLDVLDDTRPAVDQNQLHVPASTAWILEIR
ncbi:glycoside hydrolase family 13 protein [Flavobacteriales bacterium]|nr:glycoside hydrolase family 13 protein [Flavobacteriales bacterium]